MSAIAYATARAVNDAVNASTTYRTDMDLYGAADFWTEAAGEGDCEDYALAKRRRLLDGGAAPEHVRLAVCTTEDGGLHAVLIATTDEGEYVLDNRYADPMPRDALGYRWHTIEQEGQWFTVL